MCRTVLRKSLGLIGLRSVHFACCSTFDKVVRAPIFCPLSMNNTVSNEGVALVHRCGNQTSALKYILLAAQQTTPTEISEAHMLLLA